MEKEYDFYLRVLWDCINKFVFLFSKNISVIFVSFKHYPKKSSINRSAIEKLKHFLIDSLSSIQSFLPEENKELKKHFSELIKFLLGNGEKTDAEILNKIEFELNKIKIASMSNWSLADCQHQDRLRWGLPESEFDAAKRDQLAIFRLSSACNRFSYLFCKTPFIEDLPATITAYTEFIFYKYLRNPEGLTVSLNLQKEFLSGRLSDHQRNQDYIRQRSQLPSESVRQFRLCLANSQWLEELKQYSQPQSRSQNQPDSQNEARKLLTEMLGAIHYKKKSLIEHHLLNQRAHEIISPLCRSLHSDNFSIEEDPLIKLRLQNQDLDKEIATLENKLLSAIPRQTRFLEEVKFCITHSTQFQMGSTLSDNISTAADHSRLSIFSTKFDADKQQTVNQINGLITLAIETLMMCWTGSSYQLITMLNFILDRHFDRLTLAIGQQLDEKLLAPLLMPMINKHIATASPPIDQYLCFARDVVRTDRLGLAEKGPVIEWIRKLILHVTITAFCFGAEHIVPSVIGFSIANIGMTLLNHMLDWCFNGTSPQKPRRSYAFIQFVIYPLLYYYSALFAKKALEPEPGMSTSTALTIFGLTQCSDQSTIRSIRHQLGKTHHPDKCASFEIGTCGKYMGEINNAFEVLMKRCQ